MKTQSKLYYEMLRIRMIEEEIAKRYVEQKMRCPVHLSIGQEAAAVGVCAGLKPEDHMVSTHRAHAHYLAKGGSLQGLIGELYGKRSGCSRGNGGSMHLIDLSVNFHCSTSIVCGTVPVGVGIAFACNLRGEQNVTAVCIGDAAIEEGLFHEAANFASLHRLKVIFVIENNLYSCYTHIDKRQPDRETFKFLDIARAHDLAYFTTKPNDVEDIKRQTEHAHIYNGPSLLEIPTYRTLEHCGPNNDDHLKYRSLEELEEWRKLDPLDVCEPRWSASYVVEALSKIKFEIDQAFCEAEDAPYPGEEEIGRYVYKTSDI